MSKNKKNTSWKDVIGQLGPSFGGAATVLLITIGSGFGGGVFVQNILKKEEIRKKDHKIQEKNIIILEKQGKINKIQNVNSAEIDALKFKIKKLRLEKQNLINKINDYEQ